MTSNGSGYDKSKFIELPKGHEELVCSICFGIFNNPIVTPCGCTFCNDCIRSWLRNGSNTCPTDRKGLTAYNLSKAPRSLINIIKELIMRCENETFGCKGFRLGDLATHAANCEFGPHRQIDCKNSIKEAAKPQFVDHDYRDVDSMITSPANRKITSVPPRPTHLTNSHTSSVVSSPILPTLVLEERTQSASTTDNFHLQRNRENFTKPIDNDGRDCTDCSRCTNCRNCKDCKNCTDCRNCKDCNNCQVCTNCKDCRNCKESTNCKDCNNCQGCLNCDDCRNCIECTDCRDCNNCQECTNVKDCKNCKRCTDSKDCKNCQDCNNCKDCVNCQGCTDCTDCTDCIGCVNCKGCINCIGCVNGVDCRNFGNQ